jgi:hypothetical protein
MVSFVTIEVSWLLSKLKYLDYLGDLGLYYLSPDLNAPIMLLQLEQYLILMYHTLKPLHRLRTELA